jgi:hypothetical protein
MEELAERLGTDVEFLQDDLLNKPDIRNELIPGIAATLLKEVAAVPLSNADKAFDALFTNVPTVARVDAFRFSDSEIQRDYRNALEAVEANNPDAYVKIDLDADAPISATRIHSLIQNLLLLSDAEGWSAYWESHRPPKAASGGSKVRRDKTKPLDLSNLETVTAQCGARGVTFRQQGPDKKWYNVSRAEVALHWTAFFEEQTKICKERSAKEKTKGAKPWARIRQEFWQRLSPTVYAQTILQILDDSAVRKHVFDLWSSAADGGKLNSYLYNRFMLMLKMNFCQVEDCPQVRKDLEDVRKASKEREASLRQERKEAAKASKASREAAREERKEAAKASKEAKEARSKASKEAKAARKASREAARDERKEAAKASKEARSRASKASKEAKAAKKTSGEAERAASKARKEARAKASQASKEAKAAKKESREAARAARTAEKEASQAAKASEKAKRDAEKAAKEAKRGENEESPERDAKPKPAARKKTHKKAKPSTASQKKKTNSKKKPASKKKKSTTASKKKKSTTSKKKKTAASKKKKSTTSKKKKSTTSKKKKTAASKKKKTAASKKKKTAASKKKKTTSFKKKTTSKKSSTKKNASKKKK